MNSQAILIFSNMMITVILYLLNIIIQKMYLKVNMNIYTTPIEPYPRSYIITQSSLSIGMTKMAIKCTKYITVYQTRWIVIATTTNNFSCNERYFCRQIFWKRNL